MRQHQPSTNPFETVTQHLEALPLDCSTLSFDQVVLITEPILRHSRNDDLMNLAKSYSKHLYAELPPDARVVKINELVRSHSNSKQLNIVLTTHSHVRSLSLSFSSCRTQLTKLKVALDAETEGYTMLNDTEKANTNRMESEVPWKSMARSKNKSEERVQALSIIMLYLCTGLQHAQGTVTQ